MTQQYQQQGINDQREQALKNYIFDSTSLVTNDFLFNDWDALLGQIALQGGCAEIIVANENGFASVIPPGTYDMTNISFSRLEGRLARLQLDDVQFTNLAASKDLIFLNDGSIPNFIYDEDINLKFDGCAFLNGGPSTAPMIQVNAVVTCNCTGSLFFSPNGDAIEVTAGNSMSMSMLETAIGSPVAGALSGAGDFVAVIEPSSTFFPAAQALAGVITVVQRSTYDAVASAAAWAGVPTDIQSALDRIAVAVAAGAAGPIA